jgi:Family of unknown function (DUF6114)
MNMPEDGAGSAGSSPAEPPTRDIRPDTQTAGARAAGAQAVGARPRAASARRAFRDWRRSRPFWGGLLLLLAGVELIAIPLLSVLAHGSVKVVIYIGIGGVFGVLIGGLLVACGLLTWFHPVQRVFYAIAGVLLALGSFVATNLGGFFVGMLLGVIGASLSFGWTPGPGRLAGQHRPRPRRAGPSSEGMGLVTGPRPGDRTADRADRVTQEGAGPRGADHETRWMP